MLLCPNELCCGLLKPLHRAAVRRALGRAALGCRNLPLDVAYGRRAKTT
jgi:hypothetical protein